MAAINIFLDDLREPEQVTWVSLPPVHWKVLRSYDDFMSAIDTFGIPAFVSFDHDLGEAEAKTGADCARWLVELCLATGADIPDWAVHSMNPVGRENIESIMDSGRRVQESMRADEIQLRRTD